MSVSGERCAYLEGSAYWLGFLFFLGRGDEASVEVTVIVVRSRFEERDGESSPGLAVLVDEEVAEYWNLVRLPLKDGVVGAVSSMSSPASVAEMGSSIEGFAERVRAIAVRGEVLECAW